MLTIYGVELGGTQESLSGPRALGFMARVRCSLCWGVRG